MEGERERERVSAFTYFYDRYLEWRLPPEMEENYDATIGLKGFRVLDWMDWSEEKECERSGTDRVCCSLYQILWWACFTLTRGRTFVG